MCLSRGQVGRDGLTPHRRWRGKDYKRALPPFGESVQWRKMGAEAEPSRLEPRWALGIFLGTAERSNDLLVGTEAGVIRARSVRRQEPDNRANPELFAKLCGVPWMRMPGDA
eukprot:390424-Amphidinium_carterae.1